MKKDFIINQSVYLKKGEQYYDLHNNYFLKQITFVSSKKCVIIQWTKLNREWIKEDDPDELYLKFTNVSFFDISSSFTKNITSRIEEIGYKQPEDMDLDWLGNESNFESNDHFLLRFENDEFIRIHADLVELKFDLNQDTF